MDDIIKRKLNILIYLAKVDGKFHKAEKVLLMDFVNENGLDPNEFKLLVKNPEDLETEKIIDKGEMIYLALKLIQADNVLDQNELTFCKDLAHKLGYKPEVIDSFAGKELSREVFDLEINRWKI